MIFVWGRNIKKALLITIISIILILIIAAYSQLGMHASVEDRNLSNIQLPAGFEIEIFTDSLNNNLLSYPGGYPKPRMMLLKNETLMVSIPNKGIIAVLPDEDKNNKADETKIFIDGLNYPHGLDYYNGWFYIAEKNRIIRVQDRDDNFVADKDTLQVLIDYIPIGGHDTRTIKVHDESLFVSIGSSCNVCEEKNYMRASILKSNLDGTNITVFASGLRNSVGLAFDPVTWKLYATENGRDGLGDDMPPDEINLIEEGNNYGWPLCYGKSIYDSNYNKGDYIRNPCKNTTPSLINLQAHSAPLGLNFYTGNSFPYEYRNNLFVCYHGSWNRNEPTGYKVVRIDMENLQIYDFATGWLKNNTVDGRPVDVIMNHDGSIFVSDDYAGRIYRIYYKG